MFVFIVEQVALEQAEVAAAPVLSSGNDAEPRPDFRVQARALLQSASRRPLVSEFGGGPVSRTGTNFHFGAFFDEVTFTLEDVHGRVDRLARSNLITRVVTDDILGVVDPADLAVFDFGRL